MEEQPQDVWDRKLAPVLADLDAARAEGRKLAAENAALRSALEAAGLEADHFKDKFENAVRAAKGREAELQAQIDSATSDNRHAAQDSDALQKRLEALECQIKKERQKFFQQEKELMRAAEKHRVRADEERLDRVKFEELLTAARAEAAALRAESERLDETLRARDKELRLLRHETEILRGRTDEAVAREAAAAAALADNQTAQAAANAAFSAKVEKAEKEQARISSLLADAVKERESAEFRRQEETKSLEWKIDRQSREVEAARQAAAEEQERARMLQAGLAEARHDFSDLQTRYEKLERKYLAVASDARADRMELLAEVREADKKQNLAIERCREAEKNVAAERRQAAAQAEHLRAALHHASVLAERERNDLQAEVNQLRARSEEVEARARGFDAEVAAARAEVETRVGELEREIGEKVSALQQVTAAFQDETRRNQALEDQIISLRNLLEGMERRQREWQAATHEKEKEQQRREELLQGQIAEQADRQTTLVSEREALAQTLQAVREKEDTLRLSLRDMRREMDEMKECVAASAASKAYHKEKMEALEEALALTRDDLRRRQNEVEELRERSRCEQENFAIMELQLKDAHAVESEQLRRELEQARDAARQAGEILAAERDKAARSLQDERQRNQELLQNLLAMRDELENAQGASLAGKNYLKDKLRQAEDELSRRTAELSQERTRRQEVEGRLRDLRQKIEYA